MITLTEAKLEGSFPINQVLIKRFHQLFWLDININIGVAIISIKSTLLAKILSS